MSYWACYVPFGTFITWKVTSAKHAQLSPIFFVEKNEWGKGQTVGKNCSSTFVLTAFTILGQFNISHFNRSIYIFI